MSMATTKKTYKGTYLILSLKWSDQANHLIWWAPENNGYTACLDVAGRYTAEQIAANPSYYDNESTTRAVPVYDALEGLLGPVRRIVDATFRYPVRYKECHSCGHQMQVDHRFSMISCYNCKKETCFVCDDAEICPDEEEGDGRSPSEGPRT